MWGGGGRALPSAWPNPLFPSAHMEEEQLHDLEREVIECHIIRFCKPMMQKTAYELWLKDQKKDMHLKCARFLEESAHKCHRCRSGDFVPYHHFAVDIRLNSLDLRTIRKMVKAQGFKSKPPSLLNGPSHPRGVWRLRPGRPGSGPGASRVPGCNEPGEVGSGGLGEGRSWGACAEPVPPGDTEAGLGGKDSGKMGCGQSSN